MARYETRNEGYVHHPRYTGCLHRNRMLYTSLTPGLFLSAESVNRRLPQSAACHHDTVDSGGRAGSVASHTVGMFHTSIRPLVLRGAVYNLPPRCRGKARSKQKARELVSTQEKCANFEPDPSYAFLRRVFAACCSINSSARWQRVISCISPPINYCQLQAIIVPVLIIPAVNNVDDVEMTRRHGDEIHL